MAKSLLNNLLERFGFNLDKPTTQILSKDKFDEISTIYKIASYKQITNDKILVSYVPKLDYDIIDSHNLDFLKVVNKYKDKEIKNIDNTSIAISAAVTAYGRIHMTKLKLYILNKGGNIYYSDTDSIVCNIELPTSTVDSKELGKLKLEHKVNKGIFITNKTYCLIDENNKFINKAKGINSESLNKNLFISNKKLNLMDFNKIYLNYFDLSLIAYKKPNLSLILFKYDNNKIEVFISNSIPPIKEKNNVIKNLLFEISIYFLIGVCLTLYVCSLLSKDADLLDIEDNVIILEDLRKSETKYIYKELLLNKDSSKELLLNKESSKESLFNNKMLKIWKYKSNLSSSDID